MYVIMTRSSAPTIRSIGRSGGNPSSSGLVNDRQFMMHSANLQQVKKSSSEGVLGDKSENHQVPF